MKKLLSFLLSFTFWAATAAASPLSITIDRAANGGQGPFPICANILSSRPTGAACNLLGTMTKDGKFLSAGVPSPDVSTAALLRLVPVVPGIRVHRVSFATVGDFGGADYTGNALSCPAPVGDDGGSCENAPGGSWRLDLSSVDFWSDPRLFGYLGGQTNSATDTVAVQKALALGIRTRIPQGDFYPNAGLPLFFAGQLVEGSGQQASRIHVAAGSNFNVFYPGGETLANLANDTSFIGGRRGPTLRDFAILYEQPNTPPSTAAGLNSYPSAFNFQNVPRFRIERVSCFMATVCVDARGNTGDSDIVDFRWLSFSPDGGIQIDGALDQIRIINPYWWPAGAPGTPGAYYNLFFDVSPNGPLGLDVGRADGLQVTSGLFIGGRAVVLHAGTYANTYGADTRGTTSTLGSFSGVDFDGRASVVINAGDVKFTNSDHTVAATMHYSFTINGGTVQLVGLKFFVGAATNNPPLIINGGNVLIAGSYFTTLIFDVQSILITNGNVVLSGSLFHRDNGQSYTKATIDKSGGRLVMSGTFQDDQKGNGSTVFLSDPTPDPQDQMTGNVSPAAGWKCGTSTTVVASTCPAANFIGNHS